MSLILDELREALASGLIRRASTTCSIWAENYIVLGKPVPGPLRFRKHPWSKAMHDEDGNWVGMKAAQMAFTQTALDRALYMIDIRKIGVLYILPKRSPDAVDFSRSKFDALLESSPHVANMFSNVRNVGHKQAGGVDFFLRGARSRSGLKSISTGVKIYDEFDEMVQGNVALASERSSGFEAADKQDIKLSTPTVPEYGISLEFDNSTQDHYVFKCPRCGRFTEFNSLENIVLYTDSLRDEEGMRKAHLRCNECKGRIDDREKEELLNHRKANWVATVNKNSASRGFWIPQMYSLVMPTWEIGKQILRAREDFNYEQELYNSKLGLPFVQKGARVEDADIVNCLSDYRSTSATRTSSLVTMGIDVGHRELFYEIVEWLLPPNPGRQLNLTAISRQLAHGTVQEFLHLDRLMEDYNVVHACIDVDPYARDSLSFAMRFHGRADTVRFVRGLERNAIKPTGKEYNVQVNRTAWLDISQGRFKRGRNKQGGTILPADLSQAYKNHIKALTRITKTDDDGNLKSKYISVGKDGGADHFAFAHVYNEIALPLAVSASTNQDIAAFL